MARFDSNRTLQTSYFNNEPLKWQCENCGKIYPSYEKMINTKCHSHPHGAWAGCCTCSAEVKTLGYLYIESRELSRQLEERKREKSLFPGRDMVKECDTPFSLIAKMLERWDTEDAEATRNNLKQSCQDYIQDVEKFHVYHNRYGIGNSHINTLRRLQREIGDQSFWRDLYCLFCSVCITNDKHEHILSKDVGIWTLQRWKAKHDWRCMNNWPVEIVKMFVYHCITVTQHDSEYTNELQKMFDEMTKSVHSDHRPDNIPMAYDSDFKFLVCKIDDSDFWFNIYCLLRLELMPGKARHLWTPGK